MDQRRHVDIQVATSKKKRHHFKRNTDKFETTNSILKWSQF